MQANDLLGHIFNKWQEINKKAPTSKTYAVTKDFVEFAQKYLVEHPPVAFDFMSLGNGVTLSSGERVSFLPENKLPLPPQMYSGEVAVTSTTRESNLPYTYSVKI